MKFIKGLHVLRLRCGLAVEPEFWFQLRGRIWYVWEFWIFTFVFARNLIREIFIRS
jgi:hypothetical protein